MIFSLPKIIDRLLVFLVAFLVFFVPFFFLPLTGEKQEFDKLALLAAGLPVGYLLLVLKVFFTKELRIIRTRLDLPIFLLLLAYLVSSLLSISPAVSFLGEHGVFHGGFLSIILYIALFYLVVNIGRLSVVNYQLLIIASSFLLSFLTILQYFEIYLFPWSFTFRRFWTPLGGIKTLMVYLLTVVPLVVGRVLREQGLRKVFPFLSLLVSLTALFLVSGLGGSLRSFLPEKYRTLPGEMTLDYQTSWHVANSVLGSKPLFGSGPGTFIADFTRFKPLQFNQKPVWNIRFNRPANEWFETLATLGLSGIIVYIFLWSRIIRLSVVPAKGGSTPGGGYRLSVGKRNKLSTINHQPSTILSLLAFLVSTFFCPLTATTAVLFWVLLAVFVVKGCLTEELLVRAKLESCSPTGEKLKREIPLQKLLFTVYCLLFTVFGYFYFFRFFRAEIEYQKANTTFSQDQERAFAHALTATQLNPLTDVYQVGLATASLGAVSSVSQQASPSAQLIQQLVDKAIVASGEAVQLNPERVQNWENLIRVYQSLLTFDPTADEKIVGSFNRAIDLDPVNPVLRNQLGNLFFRRGETDDAVDQLFVAIRLKQDYPQSHYDLAQVYKAAGDQAKAWEQLQTVLTLLPEGGPQRQAIELELQTLISGEAVFKRGAD